MTENNTVKRYYAWLKALHHISKSEGFCVKVDFIKEYEVSRHFITCLIKKNIVKNVGYNNSGVIVWGSEMPTKKLAMEIAVDLNEKARAYANSDNINLLKKDIAKEKEITIPPSKNENSLITQKSATILYEINPDELVDKILKGLKIYVDNFKNEVEKPLKDEWMTREETSDFLKCSLFTIHLWVKKGILKPYKMGNRTYFDRNDVVNKMRDSNKN